MSRRIPPKTAKTKEITLDRLLWEITDKYDGALQQLKQEKEKMLCEAIEKFCPLPKKGEILVADYTWAGKSFSYEGFKPRHGSVILYGGVVKSNGNVSDKQSAESRIDGRDIRIIVPCEDA